MLKFIGFVAVWVVSIFCIEWQGNAVIEFILDIVGGVSLVILGSSNYEN